MRNVKPDRLRYLRFLSVHAGEGVMTRPKNTKGCDKKISDHYSSGFH
jgi:hypothetical protein